MTIWVMGDPQAPLANMLAVLRAHQGLGPDGRLRADVSLVSLGDHFDYGRPENRDAATNDAIALLEWLSSHPPEQVTILLGNHDLARVGELAEFDDGSYAQARTVADVLYQTPDPVAEAAFCAKYNVPSVECLARDLSCFSTAQRRLVERLLRERRFRLAHSIGDLLCNHAGVTKETLGHVGLADTATASEIAAALNGLLDRQVTAWTHGRLSLEPLYRHGDALSSPTGMGRPSETGGARRFHPRELPPLMQAIGHIRDEKCRQLMPSWATDVGPALGALRSLWFENDSPRYGVGVHANARLLFCDGSMGVTDANRYQLLEGELLRPVRRTA